MARPGRLVSSLVDATRNLSIQRLLCLFFFIIATSTTILIFLIPSGLTSTDFRPVDIVSKGIKGLPKLDLNFPKLSGAHTPPPKATNGTGSGWGWYTSWDWLNPFGSSTDYEMSRSVLPPPRPRCPIYAYYDKEVKENAADNQVMAAWRKAWWAAGMRPVILSPDDSKKHGLYPTIVTAQHSAKLEYNFMRWLAWDRMGVNSAMADFRVFPMSSPDNPTLKWLRRCDFDEKVTRFENFGGALFVGTSPSISNVVKKVSSIPSISADIISPADLAPDLFRLDLLPSGLAYYSRKVVADKYHDVKTADLAKLINSHLHNNFLSLFPDGFAVLNSDPPSTNVMTFPSLEMAHFLAQCPSSPKPNSCPPNKETCPRCHEDAQIKTVKEYTNSTKAFFVGMIPHPFTTQAFVNNSTKFDVHYIRRKTMRDKFLKDSTSEVAGKGTSSLHRASKLKEAIATQSGQIQAIWAPAEFLWNKEAIEFILGFNLPAELSKKIKRPPPHDEREWAAQEQLLKESQDAMDWTSKRLTRIRSYVEDWNIADFEVWKFTLAYNERRRTDREQWDKEERAFSKGFL